MDAILTYLRIIIYAIAATGMFMIAAIEYQIGKSKIRLGIMLSTSILLLVWMVLTMAALAFPSIIAPIRSWVLTPILVVLTIFIYVYLFRRTKHS
jgi:hypothetical protein